MFVKVKAGTLENCSWPIPREWQLFLAWSIQGQAPFYVLLCTFLHFISLATSQVVLFLAKLKHSNFSASWLNMTLHWWHFDSCHCMVWFQHLSAHSEASTFTCWGFSSSNYSHKWRRAIHVPLKYHQDVCHSPLVTKICLTARCQFPHPLQIKLNCGVTIQYLCMRIYIYSF